MALDPRIYQNIDTGYGLKLADLVSPQAQQRRQMQATANQLQQMQMVQGIQQMRQAPILAQQSEEAKRQAQARREAMLAQLTPEQRRNIELGADPNKVLIPQQEKLPAIVQELRAANISETSPEGQRIIRSRLMGGAEKTPVAYIDDKGRTIWGTISEARGKQAASYSPMVQSQIAGAKATGATTGKAYGESVAKLEEMEATMPRLNEVTEKLSNLGKKATYTTAGQITDIGRRELGFKVGEGAIARKEYISTVDNEILPLLRQTFGAAFTQKEGESLRATLGDPDVSPEEKDAVLKSFIESKKGEIQSLQRRTGTQQPSVSGAKFLGFE